MGWHDWWQAAFAHTATGLLKEYPLSSAGDLEDGECLPLQIGDQPPAEEAEGGNGAPQKGEDQTR